MKPKFYTSVHTSNKINLVKKMRLNKSKLAAREVLLQRLVFMSRNIVDAYNRNREFSEQLVEELKILIKDADKLGVHGAAFLDVNRKVIFLK